MLDRLAPRLLLLSASVVVAAGSRTLEDYGPWLDIKTEPQFRAAIINSTYFRANGQPSRDALFTTLRTFSGYGPWGPQIFDASGDLIFYANASEFGIQDPRPCSFKGEQPPAHICSSDKVAQLPGHLNTVPRIYDSSYQEVDPGYEDVGEWGIADGHEFHMLPDSKSYISSVYVAKPWNFTEMEGGDAIEDPWIYDSCFQEVDSHSKKLLFNWCALDHINYTDTLRNLSEHHFVKNPPSKAYPVDFIHINSIDKNEAGDYLISMKYFSQILKIAGPNTTSGSEPGSVIWRLGGKHDDFRAFTPDVEFTYQHHARFFPMPGQAPFTEVISVFDNHCQDHTLAECDQASAGKLIRLNLSAKTSHMVQSFPHPAGNASWAGGSLERLPNGNVFISWGQVPEVSEFNVGTGKLIAHTQLGASDAAFQYRSSRGPWTGTPKWEPKLLAYLRDCEVHEDSGKSSSPGDGSVPTEINDFAGDELHLYVSWNGATEVNAWRIAASVTGEPGTFVDMEIYPRSSFETHIKLTCSDTAFLQGSDMSQTSPSGTAARSARVPTPGCFPAFFTATALDKASRPLPYGSTASTPIFVPDRRLLGSTCFFESCEPHFDYQAASNTVASCRGPKEDAVVAASWPARIRQHSSPEALLALLFLLCSIAGCVVLWKAVAWWNARRQSTVKWSRIAMEDVEDVDVDVDDDAASFADEIVLKDAEPLTDAEAGLQRRDSVVAAEQNPRPSFVREQTDDGQRR